MKAKYIEVAEAIVNASPYSIEQLRSANRNRNVVLTRQAVFFVLTSKKMCTLELAGKLFGRDHATVLHGKRTISSILLTKYPESEYIFVQQLIDASNVNNESRKEDSVPEVQRRRENRETVARWAYRNQLGNYCLPNLPRRAYYDRDNPRYPKTIIK